jgi:hypothetical protein
VKWDGGGGFAWCCLGGTGSRSGRKRSGLTGPTVGRAWKNVPLLSGRKKIIQLFLFVFQIVENNLFGFQTGCGTASYRFLDGPSRSGIIFLLNLVELGTDFQAFQKRGSHAILVASILLVFFPPLENLFENPFIWSEVLSNIETLTRKIRELVLKGN